MGSKLRKLRVKACAAGERYQAELRRSAQAAERQRRAVADKAVADVQRGGAFPPLTVQVNGVGATSANAALGMPGLTGDLVSDRIKLDERRVLVAHILGSHDGANELADAIQLAAIARAQQSTAPNHEVIDHVLGQALSELRSGFGPGELSALRGRVYDAEAIDLKIGGKSVTQAAAEAPKRAPALRARGVRSMIPALVAALLLAGGSEPPRGSR